MLARLSKLLSGTMTHRVCGGVGGGGCIIGLDHNMPYHASHQRSYKQRMGGDARKNLIILQT